MRQTKFLIAILTIGFLSPIVWADDEIKVKSRQMEGEYLIASLETTLAKERLQIINDKAELGRLKVNLEYASSFKNVALGQMVVGVPLGVLWARYGFKKDLLGHQAGGMAATGISGFFGSFGGGIAYAEIVGARARITALETAVEQRSKYLDDLQQKIEGLRSSLPKE